MLTQPFSFLSTFVTCQWKTILSWDLVIRRQNTGIITIKWTQFQLKFEWFLFSMLISYAPSRFQTHAHYIYAFLFSLSLYIRLPFLSLYLPLLIYAPSFFTPSLSPYMPSFSLSLPLIKYKPSFSLSPSPYIYMPSFFFLSLPLYTHLPFLSFALFQPGIRMTMNKVKLTWSLSSIDNLIIYICVCVHACAHVCVCV